MPEIKPDQSVSLKAATAAQTDALTKLAQGLEQLNTPVPGQGIPLDTEASEKTLQQLDDILWETLVAFQDYPFQTAKKLEFSYVLKGYEMFVSRKDKSITKSTVLLSFHKALEVQKQAGLVAGPKKLGTFGASYLYPIFLHLGIITNRPNCQTK